MSEFGGSFKFEGEVEKEKACITNPLVASTKAFNTLVFAWGRLIVAFSFIA